jgi:hypothetical protein
VTPPKRLYLEWLAHHRQSVPERNWQRAGDFLLTRAQASAVTRLITMYADQPNAIVGMPAQGRTREQEQGRALQHDAAVALFHQVPVAQ